MDGGLLGARTAANHLREAVPTSALTTRMGGAGDEGERRCGKPKLEVNVG